MTDTRSVFAAVALATVVIALPAGGLCVRAEAASAVPSEGDPIVIEARFLDRASGLDAGWGATGQILIPPNFSDPAMQRWRPERSLAVTPSRQSLTLAPGERGLLRVGREIPFAGWFLQHGVKCGWLDAKSDWREVASTLEIESVAPSAAGGVRLAFTPEFTYHDGRARRTVVFPGERAEIVLVPGVEARFVPVGQLQAFYGRLLAGYDPLRRVWPVELLLRVHPVETSEP